MPFCATLDAVVTPESYSFQALLRPRSILIASAFLELVRFARYAVAQHGERGLGKPETFRLLGFSFIGFICSYQGRASSCYRENLDGIASGQSSRK